MSIKAILLVNLGTPDSAEVKDVRKYLKEFLLDGRVIDIPTLPRNLLVRGIIAPFRSPKSAKEYQKLWTEKGSPLMFHTVELTEKLKIVLGDEYLLRFAMRYQNPELKTVLNEILAKNPSSLTIIPLFPQYASATTGSVIERVQALLSKEQVFPNLRFLSYFYNHPAYVEAVKQSAAAYNFDEYDHILFSYHGLPERQIEKADRFGTCLKGEACCAEITEKNAYCYRAQCFATTRLVADKMDLSKEKYTTAFQSRLGKAEWIKPYTSDILKELAEKGVKKLLVLAPSFVSDCLETSIEIGEMYKEEFVEMGGEVLDLVPSLNAEDFWVNALAEIVLG